MSTFITMDVFECGANPHFYYVLEHAKRTAKQAGAGVTVKFVFNDTTYYVTSRSDLAQMWCEFNSKRLGHAPKEIGPCEGKQSHSVPDEVKAAWDQRYVKFFEEILTRLKRQ